MERGEQRLVLDLRWLVRAAYGWWGNWLSTRSPRPQRSWTVAPSSQGGKAVTGAEQAAIVAAVNRRYPGYPPVATLPNLIQVNVAAVAGELRAENPATLPAACQGAN